MATLEQQRASFALKRIDEIKSDAERKKDLPKYKTQLLKLPARLHTSGLGQTVAFYLASGSGSPEATICGWLETWLRTAKVYGNGRLIDWITGNVKDLEGEAGKAETQYRQASAEARALAVWLKRFAEAFLAGEPA